MTRLERRLSPVHTFGLQVRWAACQALGQMCTDLGPDLQNTHHAKVLPGLMAVMDDCANPRVQVRRGGRGEKEEETGRERPRRR